MSNAMVGMVDADEMTAVIMTALEIASIDPYPNVAALAKSLVVMIKRGTIQIPKLDMYLRMVEKRTDEWGEAVEGIREYLEA